MKTKICRWLFIIAVLAFFFGVVKTLGDKIQAQDGAIPQDRIEEPVAAIIERLIACESGGNPLAIHKMDGGSDSVGILQFKLKTFVGYALKYNLFPSAEAKELENLWTDPDAQIKVASKILKEPNGMRHWLICSIKTGVML